MAQSSIEKEATDIVKAVRKWSYSLINGYFRLVIDQRSISFIHDSKNHGKIKNAKILCWRVELLQYHYEIVYRVEKLNAAADTLSRAYCARLLDSSLYDIVLVCVIPVLLGHIILLNRKICPIF